MITLLALIGCGGTDESGGDGASRHGRGGERGSGGGRPGAGGWGGGGPGGPESSPAIPVEVMTVERRAIAAYLETNGTLEAENEVDLVTRTSGPIVALEAEEGRQVRAGQILARIDDAEIRADLEVARVSLQEAQIAHERARQLHGDQLISLEEYERTRATFETAQAQLQGIEVALSYTEIRAPFDGLVIRRYIKFAEYVTNGTPLFRISDFDPLLCPIQVPERELPRLRVGQSAHLQVEAWPGERFPARVLRIRPVVEAATGTVEVTLEVAGQGRLRPGMFAGVFLEVDRREDSLVIPKAALVLESLGDTVFLVADAQGEAGEGQIAVRRDIELGFEEQDSVEVRAGLQEGERVVVLGQSGLSDGTPVRILNGTAVPGSGGNVATGAAGDGRPGSTDDRAEGLPDADADGRSSGGVGVPPRQGERGGSGSRGGRPGAGGRGFDPSQMTDEQLERIKQRMRDRGLTDEQIEERLEQMRERAGQAGQDDRARDGGR